MKRNPWLVLVPLALVAVACSARQEPALVPNAVSPDGQYLLLTEDDPEGDANVHLLSLTGDQTVEPLILTPFDERNAALSPDGRWLAYQSNPSGQDEVYVKPFPDVDDARWQLSPNGGSHPLWAPDGSEMFYVAADGNLMSVAVQTDPGFSASMPEVAIEGFEELKARVPNGQYSVSAVHAQQSEQDRPGGELPVPIKNPDDIQFKTSAFTFVRIQYSGVPNRVWAIDWPAADRSFSAHVQNLTGLTTNGDGLVLELTDSNLSQYPFIYIVEGGRMSLSDAEVAGLRHYLLGGGFLMVDDFWGEEEWESLGGELRRVFPNREPVELSTEHEIFRSFYEFNEKPQVPSLWASQQGNTSERESATAEPHYFGLLDDTGRLMAILCHNSDFGDAWEYARSPLYPRELSLGRGVPMGVNVVVYALSH